MEGGTGMRETNTNLLDPGAQEFFPAAEFPMVPQQVYFPYPPPQPLPPPPPPQQMFETHHELQDCYYISPVRAVLADGVPTRSVVISNVPRHVSEEKVVKEMEVFGGVCSIDAEALPTEGIAIVHFYDLRSALSAVSEIREQHMRQQSRLAQQFSVAACVGWAAPGGLQWSDSGELCGGVFIPPSPQYQQQLQAMGGGSSSGTGGGEHRGLIAGQAVWAQFAVNELGDANRGLLNVFNSNGVSLAVLRDAFQVFGALKELKEVQFKQRCYKYVEFFDIRDATRAAAELNGKEINGQRLIVEFCRWPGSRASTTCSKKSFSRYGISVPPRLKTNTQQATYRPWRQACKAHSGPSSPSSSQVLSDGSAAQESFPSQKRNDTNNIRSRSGSRNNKITSRGSTEKNKSIQQTIPSSVSKQPKQRHGDRKVWKHHSKRTADSRFLFQEEELGDTPVSRTESRTTIMIRNIPNKYSQKLLLNMLDNHCIHCNEKISDDGDEPLSAYDFVYLPIDFNNKCNVGYGFVNLTSPEAAWRLHKAFHLHKWEVFNSRKICEVTYARLQGLEALKEHFRNSKFACDNDEYLPVVFSPPRDGKQLTDPVPIGGRSSGIRDAPRRKVWDLVRCRSSSRLPANAKESPAVATDDGAVSSTTASTQTPSEPDGADDDDDEDDGGLCIEEHMADTSQLSEASLRLSYSQQQQ